VFVPKAGGCDHVISYTAVTNNCKCVAVWHKFDLIDADCHVPGGTYARFEVDLVTVGSLLRNVEGPPPYPISCG
jgi:hypothetical protein